MDALLLLARYVLLGIVYLFILAVVRAIQVDLRIAAAREEPARASLVVDESALALPEMFVSAGRRGLELALAPADLLRLTRGSTAPIAR